MACTLTPYSCARDSSVSPLWTVTATQPAGGGQEAGGAIVSVGRGAGGETAAAPGVSRTGEGKTSSGGVGLAEGESTARFSWSAVNAPPSTRMMESNENKGPER